MIIIQKPSIVEQINNFIKINNDNFSLKTRQWVHPNDLYANYYLKFIETETNALAFEVHLTTGSNDVFIDSILTVSQDKVNKYVVFINSLYIVYSFIDSNIPS